MMNGKKLKKLENLLLEHCYDMTILKRSAAEKKKDTILDNLIASIVRAGLEIEDVKECISDVKEDEVINMDFFKEGGDLFKDYIKSIWAPFAKELFRQRSTGLGTPNAACGEGELMFLFLSNQVKKPNRGDIKIDGEIIELKGDNVRVRGKIRGEDFRKKTMKVCKKFGLEPNKAYRTKLDAVELEKSQHYDHWKNELSKLNISKQKEFVGEWLACLDEKKHKKSVERIFDENTFSQKTLIKEIVKILYSVMVEDRDFEKFIILNDGKNARVLSKDVGEFEKEIDNNKIVPYSDYFRINQPYDIGWYIKVN